MTITSDFFTLVTSTFSARVYPNVAPEDVTIPYCVYSRVAAVEQVTIDQNGGTGNASNTRLQADVYASTYAEAQTKAAAIKTALKTWAVENVVLGDQDFYESDTKLHRVMLDISTWHL